MLTLREAAEYFRIGQKMRRIADASFLQESGNRAMIKRKLFEEFLDRASVIGSSSIGILLKSQVSVAN